MKRETKWVPGNQTQIIFVIKVEEDRSDEEAESESYNESIEDINPILNKLKMRIEHFEESLPELSKKENSGSLSFYISYLKFHCRIFTKIMLPSIPAIVKSHWRLANNDARPEPGRNISQAFIGVLQKGTQHL